MKADIVSRLSEYYGADWNQVDWNVYEGIFIDAVHFLIIHSPPPREARTSRDRNLRFRICPWCLSNTPSCLSRCALCFSVWVSHGKHQRIDSRADAPMEIPRQEIARAREVADAIPVEDDDEPMEEEPQPEVDDDGDANMDNDDARTVAEPEMEIDIDEEGEEGPEQAEEVQSRQPVLLFDTDLHMDQDLAHFQQGLKVPIFSHLEPAYLIDPSPDYAKYMAYLIIHLMYKNWTAYAKWLEMPYETARETFAQGKRHDALGDWGQLAEVNLATGVSREVDDEEVLEFGRSQRQDDDPSEIISSTVSEPTRLFPSLYAEPFSWVTIGSASRSRITCVKA